MGRSSNNEAGSTGQGHPIFAALYDPLGVAMERRWMGRRRELSLSGLTPHVQGSARLN